MKNKIGRAVLWVLSSCWVLPLAIVAGWVLYAAVAWMGSYVSLNEGVEPPMWLLCVMGAWSVLLLFALLLWPLWLVVRTVLWIRRRQWSRLVWGWVCSACAGGVAAGVLVLMLVLTIAGPGDYFARGLTIPEEVDFVLPRGMSYACNSEASPQAKARIDAAPKLPPLSEPGDAAAPNLKKLTRDYPQLLQEYLLRCLYAEAVNPDFTAHVLVDSLYLRHEYDPQSRFLMNRLEDTIGFGDGVSVKLGDTPEGQWQFPLNNGWSLALRSPAHARPGEGEVPDCSSRIARLDAALAPLAQNPTRDYMNSFLPPVPEKPFLSIWNESSGVYSMMMVIPADFPQGEFELRAHEYTKGKRVLFSRGFLPEMRLGDVCRVICSDRWVTVESGNWDEFYGSVWEIWFTPADGGAPRCVSSQNFLMEGWQH